MISLSAYLTQGYYAFSLCTLVPWKPMFGVGSSMWLVNIITEHFADIEQMTYQYRIQEVFGWDSKVQWASMYTWFANDVSIYGVVLVMFVIGYLLALTYRDSLTSDNPFAKLLVIYFAIMCIFMPCNNQIFQSTYTLFAFFTALIGWIITRRFKVIMR